MCRFGAADRDQRFITRAERLRLPHRQRIFSHDTSDENHQTISDEHSPKAASWAQSIWL